MPIEISGTTGISGVDGSASTPALQGSDSNTGLSFGTDIVNINTGGSTRATVDSAGRLLLGTTTEGHTSGDDLTIATTGGATGITLRSDTDEGGRIFFSDGTSGADEYRGVVGYSHDTNHMYFSTDASERMRIHSNGAVSIGTNDSARSFTLFNPVSSDTILRIQNDVNNEDTGLEIVYNGSSANRTCRIGGRVMANNDDLQITNSEGIRVYVDSSREAININANARLMHTSSDDTMIQSSIAGAVRMQLYHSGGGDVTWSNPSSGTATYSTSSDYRLKQDVVDLPNAWSTVKALKPYEYKWKHNTSKTSQGFFAHEVIATVPNSQAGQGTKDAVDEDDKPIYQQIDYSKLVPVLTKALQEAIGKIETLEIKVAALEAA